MKISTKARNAIFLGTLCSLSYFAVYIARNILGAVTPKMTSGDFTLEYIGNLSAVYLLAYAFGQLINGVIGDWIKAKYMISFGLLAAGVTSIIFVQLSEFRTLAMIAYACTGFSLSMIYGPMTKMVAESTDLIYATRCSLGYTFASFFGSPAAGLLATFLSWQATFTASNITLIVMAVTCFVCFTIFEKKGIVKQSSPTKSGESAPKKDYKGLFKRSIIKFALISFITGIIRTSFVSFLTTYFADSFEYSEDQTAFIFSIATLIISFTSFIAIFIYEKLGRNLHLSPLIFFGGAAVFFVATYFVRNPITNIVLLVIAIMASNAAATILWSVYCPSLRDTGLVSSITGFLDFVSYCAAALASLLIPHIVAAVSWQNLLLILAALMVIGVIICVPYFVTKKKTADAER